MMVLLYFELGEQLQNIVHFCGFGSFQCAKLVNSNVQLNRMHPGYFFSECMHEKMAIDIVLPLILLHGGKFLCASPLPPVEFMASVFVHSEAWMIETSVMMIGLCRFSQ